MSFNIKITINGKKYYLQLKKHITIQQIVNLLYGKNRNIVLEHNKKIVAKNIWVNTFIKAEDIIEILTIVGGG
jgi:thiamine biosynthesis protein ThiS